MKPNYSKSILPQPVYKNDTDNKRRATDIKKYCIIWFYFIKLIKKLINNTIINSYKT